MAVTGPIALFDSGEGGLTVLRHLVERFPRERFLYAADSSHFPYGEKSLSDVSRWFMAFLDFFTEQGARAVVIACNTATAAALTQAQTVSPVPVIGVIRAAVVQAAALTRNRRIGVLSTEATFRAALYPQELHAIDPRLQVVSKPCPILVAMVENGDIDGTHVEDRVHQCVDPVLGQGVDTLVLGCTHFPHMRAVFNRVVGDRAHIVDPGEEIARHLTSEIAMVSGPGILTPISAWTTGDAARFSTIATKLCPYIPMVTRRLSWHNDCLTYPG
ncbi:MAG: glutamate racemase [Sulfobacillus acidophilus]|uniref:Glutamate racemase n=1 Tax=Sulfobacillus acidophilus TaxID=53633 RepID=A0A2T2WE94_9FIRM|nr:MAG: glutamate racemase [Sulfobacillus acidophilus]